MPFMPETIAAGQAIKVGVAFVCFQCALLSLSFRNILKYFGERARLKCNASYVHGFLLCSADSGLMRLIEKKSIAGFPNTSNSNSSS